MKRTVGVSVVLMMVVGAVAMAQPFGQATGPGAGMRGAWVESSEEVSLTGRLVLAADEFPRLVSGGSEYQLRIAPWLSDEVDLTNNETISVEGYATTVASFDLLSDETVVHVSAIEADGTRVVMPDRGMMMGRADGAFGGPMGGRPMQGGRGAWQDDSQNPGQRGGRPGQSGRGW